jgi:hypothetical protein
VRYQVKTADDDFEIYNAISDPKEIDNLALKPGYENMQVQMKVKVLQVRHADAEAPRPYDSTPVPANVVTCKLTTGISWKFYEGGFPWVISEKNLAANAKGLGINITGRETGRRKGVICYEGFIKIPTDGKYTFSMQTTGKAYLRLHEATLIDEDFGYRPGTEVTQSIYLKEGYHAIKLNYLLQKAISPQLKLRMKSAEGNWTDIDEKILYYRNNRN